jgi:monoamine oxidase
LLTEIQDSQLLELRKKLRRAIKKAQEVNHDSPLQQVVDGLVSESSTTAEMKRFMNFIISSEIEQEYSGSASRLSTHWYDSDESYAGEDALFREGYRVIVDYLSRDLTIQTGEVVDEINWNPGGVRIVTSAQTYHAYHCVVTLPLGVLKAGTVRFVPELPSSTQKAIAGLEMGVLNKCCLRFEKTFWPKDVDWIEYIPERHGEWAEWVSLVRACGKPILVGFNAADRGREIESWSDQQIVANAMKTLRTIFGREAPDPIDFQITRWAKDPFSMGSYSYNPFGSSPRSRLKLSQTLYNTLFFAGEATEAEYFGTVHGAYLSGLRAASEITSFDLK